MGIGQVMMAELMALPMMTILFIDRDDDQLTILFIDRDDDHIVC